MSEWRYELYVVYPDGNPTELARFRDPARALRARDAAELIAGERRPRGRSHHGVTDLDDPERGDLLWCDCGETASGECSDCGE